MPLTRIHIRRDLIAKDNKTGSRSRAIGVETAGKPKRYARTVIIFGPSSVVYSPDKPLRCGAKCWIETLSLVGIKR